MPFGLVERMISSSELMEMKRQLAVSQRMLDSFKGANVQVMAILHAQQSVLTTLVRFVESHK